ncbi:MAG TPA: biopolymer transporter ExbD [Armatimonadota bacterium]|jgi:biopolymer transport protein ExbD|nr:biopolymer transporter ExbD [Armatimonadota bacterium]HOM81129.1 biopolymer transporter ExbD [Armatimonadota bacterium]HPO72510.1 biopolymer transporter ExbD [Armatimonadota bacterium]HPT97691.1 biopolymer transporter ExbD [Armatimonadota bacterium]
MRLPRHEQKKARIEIIPMIDTIFFLLVFFMLASLAMTRMTGVKVNLPKATSGERTTAAKFVVTLTATGRYYVEKEHAADFEALRAMVERRVRENPEAVAVINADKSVRHGEVIALMDLVKSAGVARMTVATEPKTGGFR